MSKPGADETAAGPGHPLDAETEIEVLPAAIQIQWEFGDYADSYRSAAMRLADVVDASPEIGDRLALPTLFLYRHALELALKDANVWTEVTLADGPTDEQAKSADQVRQELRGHRLRPLLTRLEERFRLVNDRFDSTEVGGLQVVGPAVSALEGLDVDGQRLRYPFLSQGASPSWSPDRRGPTVTELRGIRQDVELALNYLLDVMGSWFSSVMDRAIEEAWIAQLWEAEERALRAEAIWGAWPPDYTHGLPGWSSEMVEELKSDMSAELLDDGDDS